MLQAQSSTSFKSMSSDPPEKEPEVATRMSARILFRKKLKGISNKKSQQQQRLSTMAMEHIAPELIQVGNPAHKFSFLRLVGLAPKPEIEAAFIAEQKRLSTELTSYGNSSPNFSEDEDLDDLDLEVVFCPLDIPEIYEEITKKICPGYRPPSSCGDSSSSFNNSSCSSSMSSMSSESDYYYGSGVESKNKRFSSLTHLHYNPLKLASSSAAAKNKFKSTSSSAQARRRRPPPDIIPIHPRGQKSNGSIHKNKKNNSNLIQGIVSRSPQFVVTKSLTRNGGGVSGKLNGNRSNNNNVRSRLIQNKTKFLQFDDGLDGLQVISRDNNKNFTSMDPGEDPDSLQAIKMRLGMLETELDFV